MGEGEREKGEALRGRHCFNNDGLYQCEDMGFSRRDHALTHTHTVIDLSRTLKPEAVGMGQSKNMLLNTEKKQREDAKEKTTLIS